MKKKKKKPFRLSQADLGLFSIWAERDDKMFPISNKHPAANPIWLLWSCKTIKFAFPPQSWKYWTWWTQVGARIHEILSPLSAFFCTLLYTPQMYKQSQVPACFCRCTERFYETSSPPSTMGPPPPCKYALVVSPTARTALEQVFGRTGQEAPHLP